MIQNNLDYEKFKESNRSERKSKRISKTSSKSNRFGFLKTPGFLKNVFSNKNLLSKIGITILVIVIYRFYASIPLPGIDLEAFQRSTLAGGNASEANYLFTIFTGGLLETPSIVGLGIAAYINASIMMQLLTPVIPKLTELSKEGGRGQQLINQYTRYLTLPLSFIYSTVYLVFLSQRDLNDPSGTGESANPLYLIPSEPGSDFPSILKIIFMATILTAGSMFIMWLAEVITEAGIGNGASIIISIGIISSMPTLLRNDFSNLNIGERLESLLNGSLDALTSSPLLIFIAVILGFILIVAAIVFVNESMRKIPIQYARRGMADAANQDSNLPIKLTIAGVLPIIFANALLSIPQLIVSVVGTSSESEFVQSLQNSFLYASIDGIVNFNDVVYGIVYFILIILFAMFYAFIALKPKETAENLQKQSAFVPGIRPGKNTEKYISKVLIRIGFAGGIFLGLIALIPYIASNLVVQLTPTNINLFILSGIGGTSILIVVAVVLDVYRQYTAMIASKNYQKYTIT